MSHVFVSYSRSKQEMAFRICDRLKEMGLATWIDERSIRPGTSYPEEISSGINAASAVVLLLCSASNTSRDVHNEIGIADRRNVPVIPLRLEPVNYHPRLEYYLAHVQWIDATADLETALTTLRRQLALLSEPRGLPVESVARPMEGAPAAPRGQTASQARSLKMPTVMSEAGETVQQQLAAAICARHPDAEIKKIDRDKYLDIHLPVVHHQRGVYLAVNTSKGLIRFHLYVRDNAYKRRVLEGVSGMEAVSHGLRPLGQRGYASVPEAVEAALRFIDSLVPFKPSGSAGESRSQTGIVPSATLPEPSMVSPARSIQSYLAVSPSNVAHSLSTDVRQLLERVIVSLERRGDLLSPEALDSAYTMFRRRFGPQVLSELSGDDLLRGMMAGGDRSSLLYWLDHGDPENPSLGKGRFGLIGGGAQHARFGLFQRQGSSVWVAGSSKVREREVSLPEAIQLAGNYRDQLVAGARVLEPMPSMATEEEYVGLQEQLEAVAPDLVNRAWVHKYYHMLRPDLLDDYHVPQLQRSHLVRMGLIVPERDGRYVCGHRYAQVARELGVPMNVLAAALNHLTDTGWLGGGQS